MNEQVNSKILWCYLLFLHESTAVTVLEYTGSFLIKKLFKL